MIGAVTAGCAMAHRDGEAGGLVAGFVGDDGEFLGGHVVGVQAVPVGVAGVLDQASSRSCPSPL